MGKRFRKILKRTLLAVLAIFVLLAAGTFIFMLHPQFGKTPTGERLARIQKSPQYRDGKFQNISPTTTMAEGYSMMGEIRKMIFGKYPNVSPTADIPSMKTDLQSIPAGQDVLVWFGHSSCYIQLNGKKILIDPVFSGSVSPLPWSGKAFAGADRYTVADLPNIDYLLISHDHYDHLDHKTILALKSKVSKVICGLGTGAHLEYWGYSPAQILEKDWYEKEVLENGITLFTEPARHFSGRGFRVNQSLWLSFLLQTDSMKLYISGDGGYDKHFADINRRHGAVDFAILENGQYNEAWHNIHMLPPEVLQAGKDLQAKRMMTVHNSKFVLGRHPWNEPMEEIARLSEGQIPLVTPMIGEMVNLRDTTQTFKPWWRN